MTRIDCWLQSWRIAKAGKFLKPGDRVLDIGSADGRLFQRLRGLSPASMGIDPTLPASRRAGEIMLVAGYFPKDMPEVEPFDAITMLAVIEHFPEAALPELAAGCARFLKPGGHLVITVPSAAVDHILHALRTLRLIHGMSLEEHHGFDAGQTPAIFSGPNFQLVARRKFQLGLNNLFVFQRISL